MLVGRVARTGSLTVSLVSSHPLVLRELESTLARAGFHIQTLRLEQGLAVDLHHLRLPRAQVHVVDGQAPRPVTERLVAAILNRYPGAPVLVLAEKFTDANSFPLLRIGTKGLLSYTDVRKQLSRAVRGIAAGGFWVPRSLLARFVDSLLNGASRPRAAAHPADLSRREQEVLEALLENLSNKEIASNLHISERTVKFHVSNILAKFNVRRRADLILRFYQERAIS